MSGRAPELRIYSRVLCRTPPPSCVYIKRVLCRTLMAVLLVGSCPPMVEVFDLGRECGPVYALLWESAFNDVSGRGKSAQGGTTAWSVKGIASQCGLGKATVIS